MPHSVPLIATIAGAFGLALVLGFIAVRLKMPALVGYLVAGIIVGPFSPGFTADLALTQQLAEVGVILLLFGVGLHLSLDDLLSVRAIAITGAVVRIIIGTAMSLVLALWWGWDIASGLILGLSLSVASTVVMLRALEADGTLQSLTGKIAIGWLVVEDIIIVLALVLLPPLALVLGTNAGPETVAAGRGLGTELAITFGKLALFVALMLGLGRRAFPWLLMQVARTGSRELFTLCVIAAAVGIAYGAGVLFGVSFALGAFFAGLVLQSSEFSQRAADESLPLRDAFSVLFFVSVGMLFDPSILWRQPAHVLAAVGIVVVGKSFVTVGMVLAFRYPLNTAVTVGAGLAQIGEFSFILAGMGISLGLLPPEGRDLILAASVISIAINPLVFELVDPVQQWILKRSPKARYMERNLDRLAELPHSITPAQLTGHVLIVGYGRVGRRIADVVRGLGLQIVVAEQSRELVARLRLEGIPAVSGDGAEAAVLIQGHVSRARALVIATPDAAAARAMLEIARTLRPEMPVIIRTHSDDETMLLRSAIGQGAVVFGEEEIATGMARAVVEQLGDLSVLPTVPSVKPAV